MTQAANYARVISRVGRASRRSGLVLCSLVPAWSYGVASGSAALDRAAYAPVLRVGLLVTSTLVLAVGAYLAANLLIREADERESVEGLLLRKDARGPAGRWALWYSALAITLVVEYLLAEQRPGTPSMTGVLSEPGAVVAAALGVGWLWPLLCDLASDRRVRSVPFSRTRGVPRVVREDDDVMGAVGRLSPPLLFAVVFVVAMFLATLVVGAHDVTKLLGGLGVTLLFVAGLLAAPGLLRAPGAMVEPLWLPRGYAMQTMLVARARPLVSIAHRMLAGLEVVAVGIVLGSVGSASSTMSRLAGEAVLLALLTGTTAAALRRLLWVWAPTSSNERPVLTDALDGRERNLLMLAGTALLLGASFSLAAVLSA
jgi:hypothetical protein